MSEIYQFHDLVDLVWRMQKPVEMSVDSLKALDSEIFALEALAASRLELLRRCEEMLQRLGSDSPSCFAIHDPKLMNDIAKELGDE